MFFWNSLALLMIQQILELSPLVPLPFLNPALTAGSSRFMCCWSLAWRILSITSLTCLVQFSCSVMSGSLQPHESQHARPPCPSPTSGVYSDSCPSSWWCHPAISSSVIPLCSCPQSLPASGSFPMSLLKLKLQYIGMRWPKYWSFSFSISPSNEHPGLISFRMDWLDLLVVQGTL